MIRRLLCGAAVVGFAVLGLSAGGASAQQSSGELLQGNVRNEVTEDGKTTRVPVPDVALAVSDNSGGQIGIATTDAKGHYELDLPGPGDYIVRIDQSTLPKGVELRDAAQEEVVVNVRPAERQILNYFLGQVAPHRPSRG